MKVFEASKKRKQSNKEFLEEFKEYGMTSHLSKLPDELVEELFGSEKKTDAQGQGAQSVDSAETVVVNDVKAETKQDTVVQETTTVSAGAEDDCPWTVREIKRSIQIRGNKSPLWKWRHLMDG